MKIGSCSLHFRVAQFFRLNFTGISHGHPLRVLLTRLGYKVLNAIFNFSSQHLGEIRLRLPLATNRKSHTGLQYYHFRWPRMTADGHYLTILHYVSRFPERAVESCIHIDLHCLRQNNKRCKIEPKILLSTNYSTISNEITIVHWWEIAYAL